MTAPVRLFVASWDGQAAKIGARMADRLRGHGLSVAGATLPDARPEAADLRDAALLLVVASVRYGRHKPAVGELLAAVSALSPPPPLALVSVNLTARKPGKQSAEGNPYLRKLIHRHGLAPLQARAFAGKLDYPRYGWLDRQVIRLIMAITGGPTDGVSIVDYTPWDEVDAFADQLSTLVPSR